MTQSTQNKKQKKKIKVIVRGKRVPYTKKNHLRNKKKKPKKRKR